MQRVLVAVFLASLCLPLPAQDADSRGLKNAVGQLAGEAATVGRQYVVLIGIDKYANWMALRNPVKDLREVREILERRYYVTDFVELYDEAATKPGIIRLFNRLIAETRPEDSVLVFYAGHGHLDKTSNTGFWIPMDGGTDVFEQANWLPNAQIRGFIGNMKARHIALISDSCFSGDFLNPTRGMSPTITDEYFRNAYARVSRQVLTSGASEAVPDESPFTRQLKLALEGNTSPYLDPLMIYNQVRLGVKKTTPLLGDLRDSGHQEGSSFLLFLRQETRTASAASSTLQTRTTFRLEQVLGTVSIETRAAGTLLLDGAVQGDIPAGRVARIENLEVGSHQLEMRYGDGSSEKSVVVIDSDQVVTVKFAKALPKLTTEPTAAQPPAAPSPQQSESISPSGTSLPVTSITIDGKLDDWKGISPVFVGIATPEKRVSPSYAIDKVYLAVDEKNLYMRFDIADRTPVTFLRQHNFDMRHASSYGLSLETEGIVVMAQVDYFGGGSHPEAKSPIKPYWYVEIGSLNGDAWESISTAPRGLAMKGSTLEAAFSLADIRRGGRSSDGKGWWNVSVRSGYLDVSKWRFRSLAQLGFCSKEKWKWVEGSGDATETKTVVF